ncbi:MAG: cob(I)yrinic acid a,c-diamide adenosyltransferase [Candidatus Hydrogenedentota bacterium]
MNLPVEKKPSIPVAAKRGLVLLFTGNGKGKTTAALGILLRAYGHQMRCVMLSFIKATDRRYGEHKAVEKMAALAGADLPGPGLRGPGVEIIQLGDGFTWLSENIDKDRALAQECWARCADILRDESVKIVILDEITYPVTYGWLAAEDVVTAIRNRPEGQHVVITGRDAAPELLALADTATEMRVLKHAFDAGIPAAKGIEL